MEGRAAHVLRSAGLPPSRWEFPEHVGSDPTGLVVTGGDLEPSTLVEAYCSGLFPMPVSRRKLGWFSPDQRGILPLESFRRSRSLRRSEKRFDVVVDESFEEVVARCADPSRPRGWITRDFVSAYGRLHRLGFAHSVEVHDDAGELVGGLYGVNIGSFFAGESMFHNATDASKVALCHLVEIMSEWDDALLDVQWVTGHLNSLGATEIARPNYLAMLKTATEQPQHPWT